MQALNIVILKKGRESSILRKHPWIFSGAVKKADGSLRSGEIVSVYSSNGDFLGKGFYSPESQIRVRIWSFEQEDINPEFIEKRILKAVSKRDFSIDKLRTSAYRIISAEADGFPGLVVDRYNNYLVCQFLSTGVEYFKAEIVKSLSKIDGIKGIYERSDSGVRKKEGLVEIKGLLWGEEPPEFIEIDEDGLKFNIDVRNGHKTGFYLDQRENRSLVRKYSKDKKVLNCFAYTGGFGLSALKGGAKSVENIEYMQGPIDIIEKNISLNSFDSEKCKNIKGDVFSILREYDKEGRKFDVIVLDPPKFAESKRNLDKAARGYKDINRLGFKLLNPGGHLFTYSCSGLIKADFFQKIVSDAALEAGKDAFILKTLEQSPDHPIMLNIPESLYLKGLLLGI